jgi:hypothetical protein
MMMLKEPKQVHRDPKVDTFQIYAQCLVYVISWFNMNEPQESTENLA